MLPRLENWSLVGDIKSLKSPAEKSISMCRKLVGGCLLVSHSAGACDAERSRDGSLWTTMVGKLGGLRTLLFSLGDGALALGSAALSVLGVDVDGASAESLRSSSSAPVSRLA